MPRAPASQARSRSRPTAPGAVAPLLCALALTLGCSGGERAQALKQLEAHTPRERAAAARTLARIGKPDDDELWVAIERLTRDPSVQVRIAAAESLATAPKADMREPDQRGALADDALSAELSDLDETVRIAAARVLGSRCNPRAIAYLHGAFARSGPAVRSEVAAALGQCGVPLEQIFSRAEEVRRMHALEKFGGQSAAWRVTGAHELGLLGRPDDVAKLLPLLDDRDGAVAAAAIEGLGLAGAKSAIPALQKLVGDPVPVIASAAIDALAGFGVEGLAGAQPALLRQAQADGAQALPAAAALLFLREPAAPGAGHDALCAAALHAALPAAAAVLARGCPAAPFGDALATLLKGAKAPLTPAQVSRASALLEALAQAAPPGEAKGKKVGTATISAKGAQALGTLAQLAAGDLALRAAEVAQASDAVAAGPLLLELAKREKAALDAERRAPKAAVDEHAAAARELAEAAIRVPSADRQKLSRLMAMVRARQERAVGGARPDAASRLKQLLAGEPVERGGAHPLLAAALRAALALEAKGAVELAAQLRDDPDRAVSAAARGEPLSAATPGAGVPADCFPPAAEASADAGPPPEPSDLERRRAEFQSLLVRAPSRAARPGCLAAQLALGAEVRATTPVLEAARASLWSDDGAERVAACQLLANAGDASSAPLRAALLHDPERRVRDACSASGETASPGPR